MEHLTNLNGTTLSFFINSFITFVFFDNEYMKNWMRQNKLKRSEAEIVCLIVYNN